MAVNPITKRMLELSEPIDRQIMLCDDREDILMLACVLLQKVKNMLDNQLGPEGRRSVIADANKS
jgi:hypothetical protein